MAKEPKKPEEMVSDPASIEIILKSQKDCVETCFTRADSQSVSCKFGTQGICCKICHMGPCKITPNGQRGVCGADADTIVARNFLREVAAGTAAHSDHGRHLVLRLKKVAEGKEKDFRITDEKALRRIAGEYGLQTEGKAVNALALELADLFISEFTSQEEDLKTLGLAPEKTRAVWTKYNIAPQGVDRMDGSGLI